VFATTNQLRLHVSGSGCGSRVAAAAACNSARAVAEWLALAAFSGAHAHVDVNPEPVRSMGPTFGGPPLMHADPPSTAFVLTRVNWFAG
jgi:hypothetical protein